jgi:hypothetical protein
VLSIWLESEHSLEWSFARHHPSENLAQGIRGDIASRSFFLASVSCTYLHSTPSFIFDRSACILIGKSCQCRCWVAAYPSAESDAAPRSTPHFASHGDNSRRTSRALLKQIDLATGHTLLYCRGLWRCQQCQARCYLASHSSHLLARHPTSHFDHCLPILPIPPPLVRTIHCSFDHPHTYLPLRA